MLLVASDTKRRAWPLSPQTLNPMLYATTVVDGTAVPTPQLLLGGGRGHGFGLQGRGHHDPNPAYTTPASWDEMPLAMPRDPLMVHLAYPAACGTSTHVDCYGTGGQDAAGVRRYPYTGAQGGAPLAGALRAQLGAPSLFSGTAPAYRVAPPMTYAARVAAQDHVTPVKQ